jgi:NAD-specific glutamate dehydrogenase
MFENTYGCSPEVARILSLLVTCKDHVAQGYKISTTVAALTAARLATRLQGIANAHEADSTVYVDDTALSGPAYLSNLTNLVARVIHEEGFRVHPGKIRVAFRKGDEQVVTGVTVNEGSAPTAALRREINDIFKRLKENQVNRGEFGRLVVTLRGKLGYLRSIKWDGYIHLNQRLEQLEKRFRQR